MLRRFCLFGRAPVPTSAAAGATLLTATWRADAAPWRADAPGAVAALPSAVSACRRARTKSTADGASNALVPVAAAATQFSTTGRRERPANDAPPPDAPPNDAAATLGPTFIQAIVNSLLRLNDGARNPLITLSGTNQQESKQQLSRIALALFTKYKDHNHLFAEVDQHSKESLLSQVAVHINTTIKAAIPQPSCITCARGFVPDPDEFEATGYRNVITALDAALQQFKSRRGLLEVVREQASQLHPNIRLLGNRIAVAENARFTIGDRFRLPLGGVILDPATVVGLDKHGTPNALPQRLVSNQVLVLAGESGCGKTVTALQLASPATPRADLVVYCRASDVLNQFGKLSEHADVNIMPREQLERDTGKRDGVFLESLFSLLFGLFAVPPDKRRDAWAYFARATGAPQPWFPPMPVGPDGSAIIALVVDELGGAPLLLRALCSIAGQHADALRRLGEMLGANAVCLVAVGTGADSSDPSYTVGSSPDWYEIVQLGKPGTDFFDKLLQHASHSDERVEFARAVAGGLAQPLAVAWRIKRMLGNARFAVLFLGHALEQHQRMTPFEFTGATIDSLDAATWLESTRAAALHEFRTINGLAKAPDAGAACMCAMSLVLNAVSRVPRRLWDVLGVKYGLITDVSGKTASGMELAMSEAAVAMLLGAVGVHQAPSTEWGEFELAVADFVRLSLSLPMLAADVEHDDTRIPLLHRILNDGRGNAATIRRYHTDGEHTLCRTPAVTPPACCLVEPFGTKIEPNNTFLGALGRTIRSHFATWVRRGDIVVVINQAMSKFADVIALMMRKLVLLQCKFFVAAILTAADVDEEFRKMGSPANAQGALQLDPQGEAEHQAALKKAQGAKKRTDLEEARAETLEALKQQFLPHERCAQMLLLESCDANADTIDLVLVYAGTANPDVVARCSDGNGTFDGRWRNTAGGPPVVLTTLVGSRRITWRHWCVRVDGDNRRESLYPLLDHKTTGAKQRLPPAAAIDAACKTRIDLSGLEM